MPYLMTRTTSFGWVLINSTAFWLLYPPGQLTMPRHSPIYNIHSCFTFFPESGHISSYLIMKCVCDEYKNSYKHLAVIIIRSGILILLSLRNAVSDHRTTGYKVSLHSKWAQTSLDTPLRVWSHFCFQYHENTGVWKIFMDGQQRANGTFPPFNEPLQGNGAYIIGEKCTQGYILVFGI